MTWKQLPQAICHFTTEIILSRRQSVISYRWHGIVVIASKRLRRDSKADDAPSPISVISGSLEYTSTQAAIYCSSSFILYHYQFTILCFCIRRRRAGHLDTLSGTPKCWFLNNMSPCVKPYFIISISRPSEHSERHHRHYNSLPYFTFTSWSILCHSFFIWSKPNILILA